MAGATNLPQIPELPRFNSQYKLPTGDIHQPQDGTELSDLLAGNSVSGQVLKWNDVIQLKAGNEYTTSTEFFFDAGVVSSGSGGAHDGNSWIYVISDQIGNLPENNRVRGSRDERWMPTLRSTRSSPSQGTIQIDHASHHFYFAGLKLQRTNNAQLNMCVRTSVDAGNNRTTIASGLANHIVLDRIYVTEFNHGDNNMGFYIDGEDIVVKNSYIREVHNVTGQEGHGIDSVQSQRILVDNCYIEAGGEGIILGTNESPGELSTVGISGYHCSNWTIKDCYFYKPYYWLTEKNGGGPNWQLKNHFETKDAQKVLVEDCLFENYYTSNQFNVITLKTNAIPSGQTSDVTIRYCDFNIIEAGITITPTQGIGTFLGATERVLFEHLRLPINYRPNGDGRYQFVFGVSQNGLASGEFVKDLTIRHCTVIDETDNQTHTFYNWGCWGPDNTDKRGERITVENNILSTRSQGWKLSATLPGTSSLTGMWEDFNWDNSNLMFGSSFNSPSTHWFAPATCEHETALSGVGFVNNAARQNFLLSSNSKYFAGNSGNATDGTDLGCNITEVKRRTRHARAGQRYNQTNNNLPVIVSI